MLTLTENASTIVNELSSQTEAPEAGLRITMMADQQEGLGVSTAERPEPGDQVVEQAGAKVYLDSRAADLLDDKVLDAGVDEAGNLQFALGQQA
jgi:Fe-S cluster assembly iron-binding protein IscA